MASPLAEIDWDNLDNGSQSLVTAMNLLERMFAERVTVPTLVNCAGFPPTDFIDRFPFQSNSPDYGLETWPVTWGPPISSMGLILRCYLSETKVTNILGGTGYTQFAATLDQATLFSDLGITSYPTLEVINATDVKIWYDILSSLKWIYSDFDRGGANPTTNYDSSSMEGIVGLPNVDSVFYGDIVGDMPPVSQFATDEALLFTGPTAKATANLSAYYQDEASFSGLVDSPPTRIEATILKGYNRYDITPLVNTGHTGQPQDFLSYGSMFVSSVDHSGRTDFTDYETAYPYVNNEVHQFPTPTRVNTAGNIYEYEVPFAVPATKPTGVVGRFDATFVNAGGISLFDLWDAEDGFTYYTP